MEDWASIVAGLEVMNSLTVRIVDTYWPTA
jgi:hypothetical protein